MYIDQVTKKTYNSLQEFFIENPNTSYGDVSDESWLYSVGLSKVITDMPKYDSELQYISHSEIIEENGVFKMEYYISNVDADRYKLVLISRLDQALSNYLDQVAQQRRYDDRKSCALRAGYPGPFQAEGLAFATWMDTCNALAYQFLKEIQEGTRDLPQDPQALINALPPMVWPT